MFETTSRAVPVIVLLILSTVSGFAKDLPNEHDWKNYEPVLFSIVVNDEPGAGGTVWDSETLTRNTSERTAPVLGRLAWS